MDHIPMSAGQCVTITTPFSPTNTVKHGGYLSMTEQMGWERESGPIFLMDNLFFWQLGIHYMIPMAVDRFTYGFDAPS
jgi:hypothetical protein